MLEKILSKTNVLEKGLDATWLRNEAISQNISNVDTPNYKRKTVQFEEVLKKNMSRGNFTALRTDERHIKFGENNPLDIELKIGEDNKKSEMRLDGNNVDIDSEMALMAKNTMRYNFMAQKISSSFRNTKSVISEGRK